MAPKANPNRALRVGLRAAKRSYRQGIAENLFEYGLTMNAGEAAAANQAAALTAYGRAATGLDKAAVRSLRQQVQAAKASGRKITHAETVAIRRYGSAMGATAAQQFAPAEAVGAADVKMAQAAAAQGAAGSRALAAAQTLGAQGVQAQSEAAKFAFAQALQARNSVSAETMAGLQGQLYSQALGYQYQLQLMKAQAKIAEDQAEKEGGVDKGAVHRLTGALPEISSGVAQVIRDARDLSQLNDLNVTEAAAQFAAENGYSTPAELEFITTMMQKMKQGVNAGDAVSATIDQLYGGYKGFNKWGQPLQAAATASTLINELRDSFDPSDDREMFAGPGSDDGSTVGRVGSEFGGALAGGATGAAIGTAILPGIGTAAGALLGALAGSFAGKTAYESTQNDTITEALIRTLMEENGMSRAEAVRAINEAQ